MKDSISMEDIINEYGLESSFSKATYSDDGKKALFVNPYGWETKSNIYIYHIEEEKLELIHEWEELLACKYLEWENNDNILAILGYTYGTINLGGDIYRINIRTRQRELVKKFPDNVEVTSFKINKNQITVVGIKYIDDNYINTENYIESFYLV